MNNKDVDDKTLENLMGSELSNDSGTKEAVKALMEVNFDEKTNKSDIDFKTDLLPREINGMAAAETLGRISKNTTDEITKKVMSEHIDIHMIFTEHMENHKRLRVSKDRQGRAEVRSIFTPINPMMQAEQPQQRRGFFGSLFSPRG